MNQVKEKKAIQIFDKHLMMLMDQKDHLLKEKLFITTINFHINMIRVIAKFF